MEDIKITQTLKPDELNCPICFSALNKQIYQCTNGPHYVCGDCCKGIVECPVCRNTTKPVRNNFLEEQLKPYLITCSNSGSGCSERILPWDKEHIKTCKFNPINCRLCKKETSCARTKFINHLTESCNMQFVITESVKTKNTYSVTTKYKNTIVPLGRFIAIISREKETTCHKVAIVSDDEKFINKKVKCSITTPDSVFHTIITITEIGKLSLDANIPMQLGNSFVFEEHIVNNKPSNSSGASTSNVPNYSDPLRGFDFSGRSSSSNRTSDRGDEQPPQCTQQ